MLVIGQNVFGNKTILFGNPHLALGLVILGFRAIWWPTYFAEYIRVHKNHAWPIWPVHLSWLSLLVGFTIFAWGVQTVN